MTPVRFPANLAALCAIVMFTAGTAQSLVIYRFGGEDLERTANIELGGIFEIDRIRVLSG